MANVGIYDMTDTWTNAGTTFTAIKMNVTDTASAAGSRLLDIQKGGTSQLVLDKSGNVGIGQTTMLGTAANRASLTIGGSASAIISFGNAGTQWGGVYGASSDYSLFSTSDMRFETGSPFTERMRITSSGRVGIGTSSPSVIVDIEQSSGGSNHPTLEITDTYTSGTSASIISLKSNNGGVHGQFASIYTGSDDYVRLAALTNHYLQFMTNSAERMRITSSGQVGIGTTSPNKKVHIQNGSSGASNYGVDGLAIETSSNVDLQMMGSVTGQLGITFGDSGNNQAGWIYYQNNGDYLQFAANGFERMRIDSSGNVGIGVTSPTERLHVFTSTDFDTARFETADQIVNRVVLDSGHNSYGNPKANSLEFLERGAFRAGMGVAAGGALADVLSFVVGGTDMADAPEMVLDTSGNLTISGNLIVPSGKGVSFAATAGTGTSELFDDYEEGTWTPVYSPATGAFTSITMGVQDARYIKIGKSVTVWWYIITTALNTSGASGDVRISGLPFTIAGGAFRGSGLVSSTFNWTSGNTPRFCFGNPSGTLINAMANESSVRLQVSDMSTSANKNATIGIFSYEAA